MSHALIFGMVSLGLQGIAQSEMIQRMRCGRAQGQSRTDLRQVRCLLVHADPKARTLKRQCRRQPADSAAHNADVHARLHIDYFA